MSSHRGLRAYGNSHGFLAAYPGTVHSVSCAVLGSEGEAMERDYWYSTARDWRELEVAAGVSRRSTAAVGLYDFYMWEYDYGHNLNPNAAIKIPGMAYQPPLIGSKMLLNFNAISIPHIGSWKF